MFKKMMCLPVAFLMSNVCAMEQGKVEVVIGENERVAWRSGPGGYEEFDVPTFTVSAQNTASVFDLKSALVQKGYLVSVHQPLYKSFANANGKILVTEIHDDQNLLAVANGAETLSIFPEIYKYTSSK